MRNNRQLEYCEVLKRVTLMKRKLGGLGFLIRRNGNSVPLITNIVKGGEAEARGVEVGYIIETGGLSYSQIVDKLARVPVGKLVTISFKTVVKKINAKAGKMEVNHVNGVDNIADQNLPKENDLERKKINENREVKKFESTNMHEQGKNDKRCVKLQNWITNKEMIDTLHSRSEV